MPGEALRLGPFIGGMNTRSDPSSIADSQLVDVVNLDLDDDGSLTSRPPIVGISGSGSWTQRILLIGVGIFPTGNYLIGSNSQGTYYYFSGTWNLIKANLVANSVAQYKNKLWIVATPLSAEHGGSWDPTGGFTTISAIPRGGSCISHKERLWVFPGNEDSTDSSRLKFSNPGAFDTWTPTDNLDIEPGDGTKLIDGVSFNDNLILFKNDSTHVFSYDTRPADATLREINPLIGATDKDCVVQFENSTFVYHEGIVYEIINYEFTKINQPAPFEYDSAAPASRIEGVSLSIFGESLIVRYFNRIYVYKIRTKTWSRWASISPNLHNFGKLVAMPSNVVQDINNVYYAGSTVSTDTSLYRLEDGYSSTIRENHNGVNFDIECEILTKNFDLAISHSFKRLFWWGADVVSNRDITGTATPIVFDSVTLWKDINLIKTWHELGSWGNPLGASPYVETNVPNVSGISRRHIKFKRSLRFRQINFRIKLLTSGSTLQGPAKIFTLTIHVLSKQTVVKTIS